MPKAATKSAKRSAPPTLGPAESPWRFLTRFAFVLMLLLVVVRATISESVNSDFQMAGSVAAPATPGPATGLLLDLLFCIPALLVLARRLVDLSYGIRCDRAHLIMFGLGLWTLLSVFWASDKFVAAVSAAHWLAGLVMLWSASQLVVTWQRTRVLAGVGFGVLLILLVQGYYYRFVDLPDLQKEWEKSHRELLMQRGPTTQSFEEHQIEMNIRSGEVIGFSLSRNTYAAILVLLGIISAGVAVQRLSDGDGAMSAIPIAVVLAAAMLMLYRYVESKTAYATPFIGALLLCLAGRYRQRISDNSKRLYFAGVALFVLATIAVIGHGLYHHSLLQASLTIRWQYWVGATRLFMHHPWFGVGWANFGDSYLAFRLPLAVEYPKDPHNFIIRAFVELGILGGLLTVAWMLQLWWDLTQQEVVAAEPPKSADDRADHRRAMLFLIAFPLLAMAINALFAIDWTQRWEWVVVELFKRGMFTIALLTGIGIVCLKSLNDQRLDDRPAPWLLWATLVAVGLFLVHNLIDFSLFEPGPMGLFAIFTGGALGLRTKHPPRSRARTAIVLAVFILAGAGWIVAAAAGAWNVAMAESLSQEAQEQARAGNKQVAVQKLVRAQRLVPINPEYAFQGALLSAANPTVAGNMLADAVAADPASPRYRRALAQFELSQKEIDHALADNAAAVAMDPNNMELRIEYAQALAQNKHPAEAREQFQKALSLNDQLPPTEPQRLSLERVKQVTAALRALPK
jgi:O-antigen ligase